MIFLDQVTKIFNNTNYETIKDVSLTIDEGEFVAIIGSSGAGKTTILKLIAGEIHPTRGKVFYNSVDIATLKRTKGNLYRRNIGMIFQDYKLINDKTVYENISFAMEIAGREEREIKKDVDHVLNLVGLSDKKDFFPKELSGGEKQMVAIARAVVNNPDIILADEPTGNLDYENTVDIIKILKKINNFGTTVVLTTHDTQVVKLLKTRVIRIENGEIISDTLLTKNKNRI